MSQKKRPTMAAVLTPFPYHISHNDSLISAKQMMEKHHIHHLIVMEDGDICSVISMHDLQHYNIHDAMHQGEEMCVADICSRPIIVADIHDYLDEVLQAMVDAHLDAVVILRQGELAGIFTSKDACQHFCHFLSSTFKPQEPPNILA